MITTQTGVNESPAAVGANLTTMKAIIQNSYGSAELLELRDIEKPTIAANQVLVKVRAAGVNSADWAIVGGLPYIARPIYGMGKPKNPVRGTDAAGEVEAVGASVTRFRPGDAVLAGVGISAAPLRSTRPSPKTRWCPSLPI